MRVAAGRSNAKLKSSMGNADGFAHLQIRWGQNPYNSIGECNQ